MLCIYDITSDNFDQKFLRLRRKTVKAPSLFTLNTYILLLFFCYLLQFQRLILIYLLFIYYGMSLPTDFGPDSGGRIKGVCIVKPIVYGNVAKYFGRKRDEDGHTHQWTVYVKPYHNEDMSLYIKKVHFKLHESYVNPNRIVVKPPYEINETGWGEFEIVIKIHFHDPNERPVTMYHILKLFHSGGTGDIGMELGKGLVSESYDEIVFQDPTQLMHHFLTNTKPLTLEQWKHNTNFEERKEKTKKTILEAKQKVRMEIAAYKNRLKLARETISQFKDEIARVQDQQFA